MLVDVVLSMIGIVSLVYLLFLIRGRLSREKEKVDEFPNPWNSENQPVWIAGNLRQRHTPEFALPRPFIPSNSPKLPSINNLEAKSDSVTLQHSGLSQQISDVPQLRRKSDPSTPPFYQYNPNHPHPINISGIHFDQQNLASVPEYSTPPMPRQAEPPVKPITPVGGIRGTPPLRNLPMNVSSLESLYPPPPLPPPDPITAPRGSISPNGTRQKVLRHQQQQPQHLQIGIDNPQVSSSSSSHSSSPKQTRARTFSDTPFVTIDMRDLTLQHVLGGGAFGQVWQATWKSTPVAVKVLSATCGNNSNEEELRAFNDEVQMLAHLRHPNICLFLGASLKPPNRFIVTELISRGSLWDALRKPNIFNAKSSDPFHWPWWAIRRVLDDTCRGLVYLHSHNPPIIHRDLKSANLLLDESFHVKICDFGLARLRDMSANFAMTANVGTTQWTAPEVLAGKEYSESADIYSLAIVTWEMLTGKCPYEPLSNQMEIAVAVMHKKIRPVIPPNCPPKVVEFLQVCWAEIPSSRPTAARALESLDSVIPQNYLG